MSILDQIDELTAGGGKSIFSKDSIVGEVHTGTITGVNLVQQTDFVTKKPQTWDDGSPKMQLVISLATDERTDPDDDGTRAAYIKMWGKQRSAIMDAARELGCAKLSQALQIGNRFTAVYVRDEPSKMGSPTKIYQFRFEKGVPGAALVDAAAPMPAPTPAPVAAPAAPAAPALAPVPSGIPGTPTPVAAPATADVNSQAQALIQQGYNDAQIAQHLGIDPSAVSAIRTALGY